MIYLSVNKMVTYFVYNVQILMNRRPEDQYDYLDAHPRHVMIPHRLMAYPPDVSTNYSVYISGSIVSEYVCLKRAWPMS